MSAPTFTFGTLCSGIEAASEAFLPLGAECAYVSEIEPYPCGVLADRHGAGKPMRMPSPDEAPDEKTRRARVAAIKTIDRFQRWANRLPNFGDLTQIDPEELPAVDLLVAVSHGFSPGDAERLAQTPDGPQYKALGNSKAVPLVRKIGAAYAAALARYLAGKEAA